MLCQWCWAGRRVIDWKADSSVKFWSFYSHESPCRSWDGNAVSESRMFEGMIQALFVPVREKNCLLSTLVFVFLTIWGKYNKSPLFSPKGWGEACYRSPLAVSDCGFVGGTKLNRNHAPSARLRDGIEQPLFCQGAWDSQRGSCCPRQKEQLWFEDDKANLQAWEQLRKLFD